MIAFIRQLGTGIRTLAVLTVVLGIVYPLLVWSIGRVITPDQASGSLLVRDGQVVGSSLIGQQFEGEPWFRARPSASEYDALASGASNLGPSDQDLLAEIAARRAAVAERESVREDQVPPDAVTASASGLDPFISPEYAALQVRRVAAARRVPADTVENLVAAHTRSRSLGFLGEPRVNVVTLNLALDSWPPGQ